MDERTLDPALKRRLATLAGALKQKNRTAKALASHLSNIAAPCGMPYTFERVYCPFGVQNKAECPRERNDPKCWITWIGKREREKEALQNSTQSTSKA